MTNMVTNQTDNLLKRMRIKMLSPIFPSLLRIYVVVLKCKLSSEARDDIQSPCLLVVLAVLGYWYPGREVASGCVIPNSNYSILHVTSRIDKIKCVKRD